MIIIYFTVHCNNSIAGDPTVGDAATFIPALCHARQRGLKVNLLPILLPYVIIATVNQPTNLVSIVLI